MKTRSLLGIVAVLALLLGACANSVGPSSVSPSGGLSDSPAVPATNNGTETVVNNPANYQITTVTKDGKDYYRLTGSNGDTNSNGGGISIDLPAEDLPDGILSDGSNILSIVSSTDADGNVIITITYNDADGNTQEKTITITNDNGTNDKEANDNGTNENEEAVPSGITGIQIDKAPASLGYGQALDGLVVTALYDDGPKVIPNDQLNISGYSATQLGKQNVTVSYSGKDAAFTVTVNPIGYTVAWSNGTGGNKTLTLTFTCSYPIGDLFGNSIDVTVNGTQTFKLTPSNGNVWTGTAKITNDQGGSPNVSINVTGIDSSKH